MFNKASSDGRLQGDIFCIGGLLWKQAVMK
mgnify:CR=1 FL=1